MRKHLVIKENFRTFVVSKRQWSDAEAGGKRKIGGG